MQSIIQKEMAIFYFDATCKKCNCIREVEMIMSKSSFNTIKVICMTCKDSWEFDT